MSALSAWPVRRVFRTLVVFTVVLLLCVVAAVTVSYRNTKSQRDSYGETLAAKSVLQEMRTGSTQLIVDNLIINYIPGGNSDDNKTNQANDLTALTALSQKVATYDVSTGLSQQIAAVSKAYANLSDFLKSAPTSTSPAETAKIGAQYGVLVGAAQTAVQKALATADSQAAAMNKKIDRSGKSANLITIVLCVLTGLLTGGLLLAYGRRISDTVTELRNAVDRIADGDLTHRVTARGKDEFGRSPPRSRACGCAWCRCSPGSWTPATGWATRPAPVRHRHRGRRVLRAHLLLDEPGRRDRQRGVPEHPGGGGRFGGDRPLD